MSGVLHLSVDAGEAGRRIDVFLAEKLGRSRHEVQRWLEAGEVTLDGRPVRASARVAAGATVVCELSHESPPHELRPEPGDLAVVWEDASLAVLDKPAGLAVYPGAGRRQGTLAGFLLARWPELAQVGEADRPGIVHRLDKDTTGLLVVARTAEAHTALARAFAERRVDKTYLAIAYGAPRSREGRIELPVGRHPRERQRMTVVEDGRAATTGWRVLASHAGLTLFELALETGRTHQIRVHLKAVGHPLVGDPIYGEARWRGLPRELRRPLRDFPRPALHAWRLAFHHPIDDRPLSFEAPLPEDLRRLWREATGRGLDADVRGDPPR